MRRNKKEIQPYWRPDFRIQSTLPDIKFIRTGFVINAVAILLMLLLGAVVLQREYRAYSLRSTISELETRILIAEPDDNLNLKVSEHFRAAARRIEELQIFYSSPITAHEILAELAANKPKDMIFTSVVVNESLAEVDGQSQVEYRIDITGYVGALTTLTNFKQILKGLDSLNPPSFVGMVDEGIQQRNAKTGGFPCRMTVTLVPAKVAAAIAETKKGGAG